MSPRPGTPVVHPRMLDQLRTIAEAAQLGTCQLLSVGSDGVMDPETLTYNSGDPTVLWTGPCRFQPRSRSLPNVVQAGEQPITLSGDQVTIPISAPEPKLNQRIRMLTSADPALVDRTFRITLVATGDLQAERHLTVEDDQTDRPSS